MRSNLTCLILLCLTIGYNLASPAKEPKQKKSNPFQKEAEQKWAYVNVRSDAYKFWWLYKSTHPDGYQNRPLIMWLQGGPGASSTGYGNFEIIGEADINLNPRNTSWVQEANLLFVDNPVGSGYSYVTNDNAFATDTNMIAGDLLTLLKSFLNDNPEFETAPFYIFGQSYGGKMGAVFAEVLHNAINNQEIKCALQGVAMGNAWISPIDSTMTWAPLLLWMSVTDEKGHDAIMSVAQSCKDAAEAGNWQDSTTLWSATQAMVNTHTNYIDYYNILQYRVFTDFDQVHKKTRREKIGYAVPLAYPSAPEQFDTLDDFMNGPVKEYLGIIPPTVEWGGQRSIVFRKNEGDFMKDVIGSVDNLLKTTDLHVIVYQGQLDLICDTKGAMDWVQKLTWENINDYQSAQRKPLTDPNTRQTDSWVKAYNNFKFYWNLQAGHAVPKDQGASSLRMLKRILDDVDR